MNDTANGELPDDLLTMKEASRICNNCHVNTIRRWILSGKIQGYRIGSRKMLVSKRDLLAIIRPITPTPMPTVLNGKEHRAREKWVDEVLKASGVR